MEEDKIVLNVLSKTNKETLHLEEMLFAIGFIKTNFMYTYTEYNDNIIIFYELTCCFGLCRFYAVYISSLTGSKELVPNQSEIKIVIEYLNKKFNKNLRKYKIEKLLKNENN